MTTQRNIVVQNQNARAARLTKPVHQQNTYPRHTPVAEHWPCKKKQWVKARRR